MTTDPKRLTDRLDEIHDRWSNVAAARLAAAPPRATFEDTPYKDAETRSAERWAQMIPNRFRWATLDKLQPGQHADTLRLWADTGMGNLIICGPPGTGKTFAAIAACRVAHDSGMEVHFWPIVELLDGLRSEYDDSPGHLFDRLTEDADLLILDDLGGHRSTDWADERLYAIVNRRWLDERATVITTNAATPDKLAASVGVRTLSRLQHEATIIAMDGADLREAR